MEFMAYAAGSDMVAKRMPLINIGRFGFRILCYLDV